MTQHQEVLDICNERFVDKKAGLATLWSLAGVLMLVVGSSITWALTKTEQVTRVQTQLEIIAKRLDIIDTKLDALTTAAPRRENPAQ